MNPSSKQSVRVFEQTVGTETNALCRNHFALIPGEKLAVAHLHVVNSL